MTKRTDEGRYIPPHYKDPDKPQSWKYADKDRDIVAKRNKSRAAEMMAQLDRDYGAMPKTKTPREYPDRRKQEFLPGQTGNWGDWTGKPKRSH